LKVLFIYTELRTPPQMKLLLEIGRYSAVLKNAGYECSLLYIRNEKVKNDLAPEVDKFRPQILVLFSTPEQFSFVKEISKSLKEQFPNIFQICAGLMPTLAPDATIALKSLDALCIGEGEQALLEFVSAFNSDQTIHSFRNLWMRLPSGKIIQNPPRLLEENLDVIPLPDRTIFDHNKILRASGNTLFVEAGRGALQDYIFSYDSALAQIYKEKGSYLRVRSPENIIREIRTFSSKIEKVSFIDSNFIYSDEWLAELLMEYKKGLEFPFSINAFPEYLGAKILEALKKAGCYSITIPIETGNEKLRKKITNRNISNEEILRVSEEVRKNKIEFNIRLVLGFPNEYPEIIQETIALAKKLKPDHIHQTIYYPIPGTKLYNFCKEKGLIANRKFLEIEKYQSVLDSSELSQDDLKNAYETIHLLDNIRRARPDDTTKAGFFNFITKFPEAKMKGMDKTCLRVSEYFIQGEKRKVLSQRLNAEIRYKISLKENLLLAFGIIVEPEIHFSANLSRINFLIGFRQGKETKMFFNKTIDGQEIMGSDLFWREFILPIETLPAVQTKIIFKIEGDSIDRRDEIWCGWIEPIIVDKTRDAVYIKKRSLFQNVQERADLQIKVNELERKLKESYTLLRQKERESNDSKMEIDNKVKRIGELNLKIMDLETQLEMMQDQIEELIALRDVSGSILKEKIKKILKR